MPDDKKQKREAECRQKLAPESRELQEAYKKYDEQVKYEREHPNKQAWFGWMWPDSASLLEKAGNKELELEAKQALCIAKKDPVGALKKVYTGRD